MAIGDGLCDPETMTDYGDFLFGIGLIDEDDRDYFSKVAKLQVDYIKQQKWFQAFQVTFYIFWKNSELKDFKNLFKFLTPTSRESNLFLPNS